MLTTPQEEQLESTFVSMSQVGRNLYALM